GTPFLLSDRPSIVFRESCFPNYMPLFCCYATEWGNFFASFTWRRAKRSRVMTEKMYTLEEHPGVLTVIYVPHGHLFVAYCDDIHFRFFGDHTRDFKLLSKMSSPYSVTSLCYSPETCEVISGAIGVVAFWTFLMLEVPSMSVTQEVWVATGEFVHFLRVEQERRMLVALCENIIRVYDYQTKAQIRTFPMSQGVSLTCCAAYWPQSFLYTGDLAGDVKVWNFETGTHVKQVKAHQSAISNVIIRIAVHSFMTASLDGMLKEWNLTTCELLRRVDIGEEVFQMQFLNEETFFLRTLHTFSIRTVNNFYQLFNRSKSILKRLVRVQCGPDKARLLATTEDGVVRFLSPVTGEMLFVTWPFQLLEKALDYVYDPDREELLVTMGTSDIYVLDTTKNPCPAKYILRTTDSLDDKVLCLAYSRLDLNGRTTSFIFSGFKSGKVRSVTQQLYRMGGRKLHDGNVVALSSLSGSGYLSYQSREAAFLCSYGLDEYIILSEVILKKSRLLEVLPLVVIPSTSCRINILLLIPGYICALTEQNRVRLWRQASLVPGEKNPFWKETAAMHSSTITSFDYCHTLGILVTGGSDGSVRIWDILGKMLVEFDTTLRFSRVCFANQRGDLVVGCNTDIYFISCVTYLPRKHLASLLTHHVRDDVVERPLPFLPCFLLTFDIVFVPKYLQVGKQVKTFELPEFAVEYQLLSQPALRSSLEKKLAAPPPYRGLPRMVEQVPLLQTLRFQEGHSWPMAPDGYIPNSVIRAQLFPKGTPPDLWCPLLSSRDPLPKRKPVKIQMLEWDTSEVVEKARKKKAQKMKQTSSSTRSHRDLLAEIMTKPWLRHKPSDTSLPSIMKAILNLMDDVPYSTYLLCTSALVQLTESYPLPSSIQEQAFERLIQDTTHKEVRAAGGTGVAVVPPLAKAKAGSSLIQAKPSPEEPPTFPTLPPEPPGAPPARRSLIDPKQQYGADKSNWRNDLYKLMMLRIAPSVEGRTAGEDFLASARIALTGQSLSWELLTNLSQALLSSQEKLTTETPAWKKYMDDFIKLSLKESWLQASVESLENILAVRTAGDEPSSSGADELSQEEVEKRLRKEAEETAAMAETKRLQQHGAKEGKLPQVASEKEARRLAKLSERRASRMEEVSKQRQESVAQAREQELARSKEQLPTRRKEQERLLEKEREPSGGRARGAEPWRPKEREVPERRRKEVTRLKAGQPAGKEAAAEEVEETERSQEELPSLEELQEKPLLTDSERILAQLSEDTLATMRAEGRARVMEELKARALQYALEEVKERALAEAHQTALAEAKDRAFLEARKKALAEAWEKVLAEAHQKALDEVMERALEEAEKVVQAEGLEGNVAEERLQELVLVIAEELAKERAMELAVLARVEVDEARVLELAEEEAIEIDEVSLLELAEARARELAETRAQELAEATMLEMPEERLLELVEVRAQLLAQAKLMEKQLEQEEEEWAEKRAPFFDQERVGSPGALEDGSAQLLLDALTQPEALQRRDSATFQKLFRLASLVGVPSAAHLQEMVDALLQKAEDLIKEAEQGPEALSEEQLSVLGRLKEAVEAHKPWNASPRQYGARMKRLLKSAQAVLRARNLKRRLTHNVWLRAWQRKVEEAWAQEERREERREGGWEGGQERRWEEHREGAQEGRWEEHRGERQEGARGGRWEERQEGGREGRWEGGWEEGRRAWLKRKLRQALGKFQAEQERAQQERREQQRRERCLKFRSRPIVLGFLEGAEEKKGRAGERGQREGEEREALEEARVAGRRKPSLRKEAAARDHGRLTWSLGQQWEKAWHAFLQREELSPALAAPQPRGHRLPKDSLYKTTKPTRRLHRKMLRRGGRQHIFRLDEAKGVDWEAFMGLYLSIASMKEEGVAAAVWQEQAATLLDLYGVSNPLVRAMIQQLLVGDHRQRKYVSSSCWRLKRAQADLGQRTLYEMIVHSARLQPPQPAFHHVIPLSYQNNVQPFKTQGVTHFGPLYLKWKTFFPKGRLPKLSLYVYSLPSS
uniref:WD repeat domain 87 n=1 Tax=Pseudonaja textilis TaxID=8673 RepID=A0A670ZRM3_PSETE